MLIFDIRQQFQILDTLVKSFNATWPESVEHIQVWSLPILNEAATPDSIEPMLLEGSAAIRAARDAFAGFHYRVGQHPATVARAPGWIALREGVIDQVRAINEAKDQLRLMIQSRPAGSRARLAREALPGVSLLQTYRHVFAFADAPRQILFSWAGHTTASRHISRAHAVRMVDESRNHPPVHIEPEVWDDVVATEIRQISSIEPGSALALRRTIAPHPRAMLYFSDAPIHDATVHANVPLIVRSGFEPPVVKSLKRFEREQRSALRSDRLPWVPVIDRIGLYARNEARVA